MKALQNKYHAAEAYWVQEEPSNMGGWQYFWSFYQNVDIKLIARKSSASPATGFKKVHEDQQNNIVQEAMGIKDI
jgi:2-oxoglutarate dehydrogenase E1 component